MGILGATHESPLPKIYSGVLAQSRMARAINSSARQPHAPRWITEQWATPVSQYEL